jgi:hypothetical protein
MDWSRAGRRGLAIIGGLAFVGALMLGALFPALREFVWHLLAGWWYFLRRNLGAMSPDPDILLSGLLAAALSVVCLHVVAGWWFGTRGLAWRWRHSVLAVAGVVVLFAASFLVPGVILMLRLPFREGWLTF